MRLGQMDRLMAVYKYHAPISGGHSPTYSFNRREWMAVKPLRADEKYSAEARQRYADVAVRYTAHPVEGLAVLDILKDEQGRYWDVRAVVEIGYGAGLEIDCTLLSGTPDIVTPPDPDPDPPAEGYAYAITAGQTSAYTGFVFGETGAINAEPIPGATLYSTVSVRSNAGEGGIEIVGDRNVLEALLTDKEVWIGGVLIGDESHWSFDSYMATWWIEEGFPAFAVDGTYLIELKPVEP
jgi:hypothetical protein